MPLEPDVARLDGVPARRGGTARALLRRLWGLSRCTPLLPILCASASCLGCSLIVALDAVPDEPLAEGEPGCSSSVDCANGLFCVPQVGAEYGFASVESICERSTLPYGFLTTGTRASRNLTRDAIAGVYRLPRALDSALTTTVYMPMTAQGAANCGSGQEPGCQVPDWALLWGKNEGGEFTLPSKYDQHGHRRAREPMHGRNE